MKGKALKAEARTLGIKYVDHEGKAESAAHAESRTAFEWQWNQLFSGIMAFVVKEKL